MALAISGTSHGMTPRSASPLTPIPKVAADHIAAYRAGQRIDTDESIAALLRAGHVDPASLMALSNELRTGPVEVRESIVDLLMTLAFHLADNSPDPMWVIADQAIIKVLLFDGLAKPDSAADRAVKALEEHVRPNDLAQYGDVFVTSLEKGHGDHLFLAAKAKTKRAKPHIDRLAKEKRWRENLDLLKLLRIAQAALGDSAIETEFIEAVRQAERRAPPAPRNIFYDVSGQKDGAELPDLLQALGRIGTRRSLRAACSYVRSPMKTYVPNHYERSIRLDAVDAIRYNYPDEPALKPPKTWDHWRAVERFCTQQFGAVLNGPTPDMGRDNIYPHLPR